jgi:hypothetical protein
LETFMARGRKGGAGKTGRISLRVKPELHEQLAELAQALGQDINGLLNMMVRQALPKVVAMARTAQAWEAEQVDRAFKAWREENPGRPTREFWEEYLRREEDELRPPSKGRASREGEEG